MKKSMLIKIVSNKFFLTAFAFIIWTAYFDQNDWMTMQQRKRELNTVKANIAYLNGEIKRMNAEKDNLLSNNKVLEQYARENYRMKHEGEDVYVIEKK